MNSRANKTQGKNGTAAAHSMAGNASVSQLQDKRPEAAAQGKLVQMVAKSQPVIQRYAIVQPGSLTAQNNATVETQDLSQTRYGSTYVTKSNRVTQNGINPTTQETTRERVSGAQNQQVSRLPSFKVSQTGFMAIPATGQAKNLYTDNSRVAKANQTFTNSGAKIRLKAEGHGITVPQNPVHPNPKKTRNLKKVHAAMEVPGNVQGLVQTQIQQILPDVECNAFIRLVMGASGLGSRVAVLEERDQPNTHREVGATEGQEPTGEISTHMSVDGQKTAPQMRNLVRAQPPLTNPQISTGKRNYENLTTQDRSNRARPLGINEHVNPEVGEGMVIRSMETNAKLDAQGVHAQPLNIVPNGTNTKKKRRQMRDSYLQAIQDLQAANGVLNNSRLGVSLKVQNMMRTWGVHYAGVVARDGGDMVTLENYNRATEISWEHERIFNNLFQDFAEFRNLVSARVNRLDQTPDMQTIQQLVNLALQVPNLQVNYQQALQEATQSFVTGMQQTQDTFEGNFYFDMYGRGGQSFHARYKGLSANPMTLHIKENLQPVRQSAIDEIQGLNNRIVRWETPILANPIGTAQPALTAIINHARTVEQQCNQAMLGATTRGQFGAIADKAMQEAVNVFNPQIRQAVMNSYQAITGNAPVPAANDFNALIARCNAFRNTYSWYHRADAAYNNITNLRTILQALVAAGL